MEISRPLPRGAAVIDHVPSRSDAEPLLLVGQAVARLERAARRHARVCGVEPGGGVHEGAELRPFGYRQGARGEP